MDSHCIWECVVLNCLGKTLSVLTLSPPLLPPSLSFPLFPPPSQQLFSCLGWELEPSCFSPHPCVTSRNSPTYWHTQTHTRFVFLCLVPHSSGRWLCIDFVLDCRLKSKYSHSSTWLLWLRIHIAVWEPSDCSEKCFHGKMSFRLTGHFSLDLLLFVHLSVVTFSPVSRLSIGKNVAELIPSWQSPKVIFFFFLAVWHIILVVSACLRKV